MYGIAGKVAVVTGAAQGIGAAIALRLAGEGVHLVLADLKLAGAVDTAEAALAMGVRVVAVEVDVRDSAAVRNVLDTALGEFDHVDHLVNVAGICTNNFLADVTEEEWDRVLDINLKGTFLMAQTIGLHMAGRKQGRIVNIASVGGKTGYDVIMPYTASKAGVINLTQSMARALGPSGVTVNAICPGFLWTALTQATTAWRAEREPVATGLTPYQIYLDRVALTALKQETTPADIAAVTAFLLSDQARTITGQSLNVCGGAEFH